MTAHLSWRDTWLAVAIVFVWGTNFVVIRLGLDALPPLFFASLRFLFVFLPAALVLPRPRSVGASDQKYVAWSNLAIYGVCIGLFQFGLLFIAMNGHIPPGLASLVVQMQVFFTIGLAMWRTEERIKSHQIGAFALALAGMAVIAAHHGQGVTLLGVGLVLLAAMGWALGNQASREAGKVNMLAYVVWGALFSVPPLLILSLLLEGPAAIAAGLARAGWVTWAAVLWQSVGNTMFGYACWGWLLSRYPAATVAPMSLLVPIFGFGASAAILHEPLPGWKIGATLLIMAGLAVNLFWVRRGQPKADETVQWTVSSDERRELGRAAGGSGKSEIGGEPI
jgi:O-acetylserine/cysteine efflux transporter